MSEEDAYKEICEKYKMFNKDSVKLVCENTYEIGQDSLKYGPLFYKK